MYGSSLMRVRHGRGADWHNRLAMTQAGYYRADGFFSSLVKGVKKAASVVQSIGSSTVGQVLAPLNPFGRIASAAQGLAGNIPGIGGMVKAGSALQGMLFPTGKGPQLSQAAQAATGALGFPVNPLNYLMTPGGMKRTQEAWAPFNANAPTLESVRAKQQAGGGPAMMPSHTPFGGMAELPPASTRRKRRRGGTSKRRRSPSRRTHRRSRSRRSRAPARRGSSYRRGDYGDDWSGNRPSRAKRSGRFLTRRGGRRHHRRGGRVHFRTKDGRMVSFTPRHRKRRRRGHGASGTY